jgi:hypothetical protein
VVIDSNRPPAREHDDFRATRGRTKKGTPIKSKFSLRDTLYYATTEMILEGEVPLKLTMLAIDYSEHYNCFLYDTMPYAGRPPELYGRQDDPRISANSSVSAGYSVSGDLQGKFMTYREWELYLLEDMAKRYADADRKMAQDKHEKVKLQKETMCGGKQYALYSFARRRKKR